jgi:hypothetical protein
VQGFGGVGGNGVAGFGGVNGVAGYGGTTQGSSVVGTGVSGLGGANEGAQGGLGVQGVGGSGPNVTGGIGVLGFGGGATAAAPKDNAIGVCGIAGFSRTLNADGVYGIGGGVYSGVVGFGDPAPPPDSGNGTGVFGVGGFPSGPGVRGYGYGRDQTYRLPLGQSVSGNAIGVFGQGGSPDGDGVYGVGSGSGYGGDFEGGMGLAPLLLRPSNHSGHPTTGNHLMGELYVDKDGSLWYCKRGGAPGTWVKLA